MLSTISDIWIIQEKRGGDILFQLKIQVLSKLQI